MYPIRNDVTKGTRSALNVYKGTRVLTQGVTHGVMRCDARQRMRNTTQSIVTTGVVCCLQIKQVRTMDLSIWEWIEGNLCSVF